MKPQNTYIIFLSNDTSFKIGVTVDVDSRVRNIQCANPFINKVKIIENKNYEHYLHRCLDTWRFKGEWFNLRLKNQIVITVITYLIQLRENSLDDCDAYHKWINNKFKLDKNLLK